MDVTKTLWFSVQVIADRFYQFSVLSDMQKLLGLRLVKAHEVGIFSLNGLSVPRNTVLHPCLSYGFLLGPALDSNCSLAFAVARIDRIAVCER